MASLAIGVLCFRQKPAAALITARSSEVAGGPRSVSRALPNGDALIIYSNLFRLREGQQFRNSRIVKTVVLVHEACIHVERRQDSFPEIHGINPETDAPNSPFPLQLHYRLIAFGKGLLGVLPPLAFDIVNVDQIKVISA